MKQKIRLNTKIQFFQNELAYHMNLQQKIDQIRCTLKNILAANNFNEQASTLKLINQKINKQKNDIQQSINQIKRQCNLQYDAQNIQGKMIFTSLQNKVEDLNNKLYEAQSLVQKAQNIRRQLDIVKAQYQMSNIKHFKKASQKSIIQQYTSAKKGVLVEFERSINLALKIYKYAADRKKEQGLSQLQKILNYRNQRINFQQIRSKQMNVLMQRHSKSMQKCSNEQYKQKSNNKKQPFLSLIIRSQFIPYKKLRGQGITEMIVKLKLKNKQQSQINKMLSQSLQLRNRSQVLKYLQNKCDLNQQQSIMKIQLMANRLNQQFNERMIGVKSKRSCFEDGQIYHIIKNKDKEGDRIFKSLQKNNQLLNQHKSKREIFTNMIKNRNILMEKQQLSFPKTNDSLTTGQHHI